MFYLIWSVAIEARYKFLQETFGPCLIFYLTLVRLLSLTMVYKEPKQGQFMFGVCILLCLALAMKYTGDGVNEVTVTSDVVAISNERVRLMVVNISLV